METNSKNMRTFSFLPNSRWVQVGIIGLTQQASVRRGPRASATSILTVSLAASEASAFFRNRVCVSPILYVAVRHLLSIIPN